MTTDEILMDTEERMEKAVNVFRDELRGLRTGRATPALVDGLRVEYYGSPTPLKQLAQISTPDPHQIIIKPFDPSVLKEIEKAIRSSDLGMSPNNDGKMIRLTVPPMSGEQRRRWRRASRSRPRRPRSPAATSAATATSISTPPRRTRR